MSSEERRGFLGHFTVTTTPCPKCEAAGVKNNGGQTPTLRQAEDGSLHCMGLHGEIKQA